MHTPRYRILPKMHTVRIGQRVRTLIPIRADPLAWRIAYSSDKCSTGVVCVLIVVVLRLRSGYCQSEQIVEDRVGSRVLYFPQSDNCNRLKQGYTSMEC